MIKKIGIITSGGDCGGLNALIKGAALMTVSFYKCMGICFGRNPGKYKIESEGVTDEAWKYL